MILRLVLPLLFSATTMIVLVIVVVIVPPLLLLSTRQLLLLLHSEWGRVVFVVVAVVAARLAAGLPVRAPARPFAQVVVITSRFLSLCLLLPLLLLRGGVPAPLARRRHFRGGGLGSGGAALERVQAVGLGRGEDAVVRAE